MKVVLLNGSPHAEKCTYTALCEVQKILNANGVETEIVWVGTKPIAGCIGCNACKGGKCVFGENDGVNAFIEKAKNADGFIFGTAVHYASASGAITSFLDRAFYAGGSAFKGKPGAAVVSCRRAGSTATLDQLNKYFTINEMPVVSSGYWNMVHGSTVEQVMQDGEGLQVMRRLGENMAYLLKCIEAGRAAGITPVPPEEVHLRTDFIR